jgi:hypothetical protein
VFCSAAPDLSIRIGSLGPEKLQELKVSRGSRQLRGLLGGLALELQEERESFVLRDMPRALEPIGLAQDE